MPRKYLQIIETAYRATVEEQDDTTIWFVHALKGGGADVAVLLRGNAVNYAVKDQDASGLAFGARKQTQPPRVSDDVAALVTKGVEVFYVDDDVAERGIERTELLAGLQRVERRGLPELFGRFDRVWHW